jgi:hypothetical protein
MIPLPTGVRVWIAAGHSDMRRGMQGLARQVPEGLQRDPHICGGMDYYYVAAGALEPLGSTKSAVLPPHNV